MNKEVLLGNLGERVRKIRLEKKLSQSKLAAKIGKDQQVIHKIETGKMNPSYVFLNELAIGLEMSLKDFLNF